MIYKPGSIIEVGYPFVREMRTDAEGAGELTWRPGTRDEACASDDFEMVADGIGTMILTIVSVHKPGRYPTRVFYERRWRDPSGREFGKGNVLRVAAIAHFSTIAKGYRHHYRVNEFCDSLKEQCDITRTTVQVSGMSCTFIGGKTPIFRSDL